MKRVLLALITLTGAATADVYIWTGEGGDNLWHNSSNWDLNNSYFPQGKSDTAVINSGSNVIVWTSTQGDFFGETDSIILGAGNTIRFEVNHDAKDLKVNSITLGGGALFKLSGTNAIGYDRNFTINYGTFTADSHGLFDANMERGTMWSNNKTITLTGNFDTTNLVGEGSITLYDASAIGHGGGDEIFDVSGIVLNTTENIAAEIVTTGNKVVINYSVTPSVPEPTTATLSLLTLCGLAARRRRK